MAVMEIGQTLKETDYEVLQEKGPDTGMPLSRSLKQGLHELRIPYEDVAYRVFCGFVGNQLILLLHGMVKKSQKTPKKDIELARKRLAQVKKG